jgi:hypothetical protein
VKEELGGKSKARKVLRMRLVQEGNEGTRKARVAWAWQERPKRLTSKGRASGDIPKRK